MKYAPYYVRATYPGSHNRDRLPGETVVELPDGRRKYYRLPRGRLQDFKRWFAWAWREEPGWKVVGRWPYYYLECSDS